MSEDYERDDEMLQIGTADTLDSRRTAKTHQLCGPDCDCGHWGRVRRSANPRGTRGRVTLDTIEGNDDGSR